MKKLFAMLMAVVMIFSLATVAFAEEAEAPAAGHGLVSEETTYTAVIKAYDVTGGTILPVETLEFVSVADTANPDGGAANLTIAPLAVTAATMNLDITVPSFSEVGTYHFTITETAGEAQGAVYSDGEIYVSVLVTFNYEEKKLDTTIGLTTVDDGKEDTITNTYGVGSLKVSKVVTGNLGDTTKKFDVTVTFTAEDGKVVSNDITYTGGTIEAGWEGSTEVVISLAHGEFVTFENIPEGVTYTVVEADYTQGELNGENAYDAPEYAFSDEAKAIAAADADTVEITNNKETDVDTGIVLDSMPYVVILAVACFGMFAMMTKKRYEV